MDKKEKGRERSKLMRQMQTLARAKVNDAVKLAYLTQEEVEMIDKLDLTALTEFKRDGNGQVAIKFNDRMKVIERMLELSKESDDVRMSAILDSLGGGEG